MISRAEIMHWESMQTRLVTDGIETNLGKSFLTRIDIMYVCMYVHIIHIENNGTDLTQKWKYY